MNFIGRFESLEDDFKKVSKMIGVQMLLPYVNAFDRKHYRTYFGPGDVEKVRRIYKRDLEHFGYDF